MKTLLDGTMIIAQTPEKIQNMRKWMQSWCSQLWPFRSEWKEKFYHSILPHVSLL